MCRDRLKELRGKSLNFFYIDDTTWQDDMKEVERLKEALEASDDEEREGRNVQYVMRSVPGGKGLRYRLTAVGEYRDVVPLKRLQDVKRNAKAKVLRMKFIRPCLNCCCFAHCSLDCQNEPSSSESILSKFHSNAVEVLPTGWLDRSWISPEQYEEEIMSLTTLDKSLVELITAVNMDLSNVDASTLGINL